MAKLSVDQTLLRAKAHGKKGDLEEAQHLYQLVLQSFPKNKRAQQGLAALNESEPKAASKSLPRDLMPNPSARNLPLPYFVPPMSLYRDKLY